MEIRDGFIVGVYNYCDAWCDRCAFTSYCRVFADMRQMEVRHDPDLEPVATSPEHPSEAFVRRDVRAVPQRDAIDRRAEAYSRRAREWLGERDGRLSGEPGDPRDVIAWFHMMIHVKSMRALQGLAADDPSERDWPPDHDGSAKVALIGIDRSHTAWLDLVQVGQASPSDVTPFLDDLDWLRAALERTFPKARSFVRAAFDEPEEVARLLR